MKIAITGGTGLVGRFLVQALRAAGHDIALLGRRGADLPYALGDAPDLTGFDALIHCAFAHEPGRYRGGEGDDPEGFIRANLQGSVTLFETAKRAGLGHVIFLSSRAVYGDYPPGTPLSEEMAPRPDTLYGQVKWQAEQALETLAAPGFATAALRATGVYGPGPGHKWTTLFEDFLSGKPVAPRRATEVHGRDLAQAAQLVLHHGERGAFNVSDILLDRHDLLTEVARVTGSQIPPPPPANTPVSGMTCDRLGRIGWQPGGLALLHASLPRML